MAKTQYFAVTAIRVPNDRRIEYQVEVAGNVNPYVVEMVADEIKKQAGVYEYLPLETFLLQQGLELITVPSGRDEPFHVRIGYDVCIQHPKHSHNLVSASATGNTAAEARRRLQAKTSGQILVANPMLPIRRSYEVPDFSGMEVTTSPETPEHHAAV